MDNKVDFFQKKLSNPRSFSRKKRISKVWILLLVVLSLLVLGFLAWMVMNSGDNNYDYGFGQIQDRNLSL
jgi:flagellar basal body-associated protein FliL